MVPEHRQKWLRGHLNGLKNELEAESRLRLSVWTLLKRQPIPFVLEIHSLFPYAGAWEVSADINASGPCRCANDAQKRELTFFDDETTFPIKTRLRVDFDGSLVQSATP